MLSMSEDTACGLMNKMLPSQGVGDHFLANLKMINCLEPGGNLVNGMPLGEAQKQISMLRPLVKTNAFEKTVDNR